MWEGPEASCSDQRFSEVSEVVTVFGLVTQSQGREMTLGTRLVQVLVLLSKGFR